MERKKKVLWKEIKYHERKYIIILAPQEKWGQFNFPLLLPSRAYYSTAGILGMNKCSQYSNSNHLKHNKNKTFKN